MKCERVNLLESGRILGSYLDDGKISLIKSVTHVLTYRVLTRG